MAAETPTRHVPSSAPSPAAPGPRARRRTGAGAGARLGSWTMGWYVGPAVLFMVALSALPLLVLIRMGLSDITPRTLLNGWHWVGFANYAPVLTGDEFWTSLLATAYFTAFLLVVNVVVGFLAACWLTGPLRGAGVLQGVMVFIWATPPVVIGNVWKFLFADDGLVNSSLGLAGLGPVPWLSSPALAIWSVSIVAAWASLPFSVILIKSSMLSIPAELYDAAAIDGAGLWQTRLRITLPLLRPTLLILAVFTVMYGFRSFDFIYVLTGGGPGTSTATLPFLAYRDTFTKFDFSQGSVVASVSLLIVFGLGLVYLRTARKELSL
ncbi:carbohydrate ABC transporter permease [Streptomyces odontomachi]|uniref:carbohydrate ABC transporter permease n=1 Tax=Streptomyces odontomachi TaxID=2944940 RepID=UPI00210D086C|nr:sugar ABC transporter permease [Streptomyces sp. ODS25]